MDILLYGGGVMRLSVQGCLILGLCFYSSSSYSETINTFWQYLWQNSGSNGHTLAQVKDSQASTYNSCVAQYGPVCYYGDEPAGDTATRYFTRWISGSTCQGEINPDGGACIVFAQPNECYEAGQIYDATNKECVLDCGGLGQLDGVCLQSSAQNNDTCNSQTSDYQGSVGFGNTTINICASQTQCDGGSFGVVNGTPTCIPDAYGPPTCPASGALVIDEYGFVCESLNNAPEAPQVAEEPNTDTNGDGIPDEYQRENDPNSTDKAIDLVGVAVGESNEQLAQVNQQLGKANQGIQGISSNIKEGLGALNDTVSGISDGMAVPEGGFNPDGFGGLVPTFEETGAQFIASINGMSQVQALTDFVSIGTNNTCPVYTLPATPVSQPIVMDIHCAVFEEYRATFAALFMFFWAGLALFIFFRA
ncbi:hypothetical protein [Marinobacter sp.]|uniref:hypothetical protein n=1 Tax=Marinobacter sp. TaxID=50741 RepID=UPI0019B9BDC5|nr:hypothetical protein [Marinobacter sp.]MBD3657802.1 hypothetical protein [Marinobacter sp.]